MDARFALFAARAAEQHHVLSLAQCDELGIPSRTRSRWRRLGLIEPAGVRAVRLVGTATWHQSLAAGLLDLGPDAAVAGRSAAALLGLDGFAPGPLEFLVPRHARNRRTSGRVVTTTRELPASDVLRIDGLRCVRAERLILDAPLFEFTAEELENAIDSAVRLRLTSDPRLLRRVGEERASAQGSRVLLDALVDAGGESKLERRFLTILRRAGLPRPELQVSHHDGGRLVARVDTLFGGELVIEVEGHATHSSRRQRQADEQRRTELTLRGRRVIVFTYDDVFRRPEWTAGQVKEALSPATPGSGRSA